jgi:hypothetical protein
MRPYEDVSGRSGVRAFEIGDDFIKVKFTDGHVYTYDYSSPGQTHVENMKRLAQSGRGLSTYISQNVRGNFSEKSAE